MMNTAFDTIKKSLTHPPVPPFPSFKDSFQVEKDVSSLAAGAVLSQKKGQWKNVPCPFCKLNNELFEKGLFHF